MSRFPAGSQPIQHVYGPGTPRERELYCSVTEDTRARVPTIADLVPVTDIMSRDLTCARRDLSADELVELMVAKHIGCVPVVEDPGRPIGMVTKLDLVEQLLAARRDAVDPRAKSPLTAGELMMPLAITLPERASVAHAAAMMAAEDVHHVPIVDVHGRMIGLVSSMDIVRWLARNDGFGGG